MLTSEQKEGIKEVFAIYFRNWHEYMGTNALTMTETLEEMKKSSVGPGPDFFPSLEMVLGETQSVTALYHTGTYHNFTNFCKYCEKELPLLTTPKRGVQGL